MQTSDWSRRPLSPQQLHYAALDAAAQVHLLVRMCRAAAVTDAELRALCSGWSRTDSRRHRRRRRAATDGCSSSGSDGADDDDDSPGGSAGGSAGSNRGTSAATLGVGPPELGASARGGSTRHDADVGAGGGAADSSAAAVGMGAGAVLHATRHRCSGAVCLQRISIRGDGRTCLCSGGGREAQDARGGVLSQELDMGLRWLRPAGAMGRGAGGGLRTASLPACADLEVQQRLQDAAELMRLLLAAAAVTACANICAGVRRTAHRICRARSDAAPLGRGTVVDSCGGKFGGSSGGGGPSLHAWGTARVAGCPARHQPAFPVSGHHVCRAATSTLAAARCEAVCIGFLHRHRFQALVPRVRVLTGVASGRLLPAALGML